MKKDAFIKVVYSRETFIESVAKDIVTFGMLLLVVGIGIWLDSWVLQIVGAVFWIIGITIKFTVKPRTIAEARVYLDELEKNEQG